MSRPGRFTPVKETWYSLLYEAEWASGQVWTGAENLTPPGFDPRTLHPVGSRYTDYTSPYTFKYSGYYNYRRP